jgi:hypothetical protein
MAIEPQVSGFNAAKIFDFELYDLHTGLLDCAASSIILGGMTGKAWLRSLSFSAPATSAEFADPWGSFLES